mmetsp:Transcript_45208/g.96176  ORF Transcript_45208/g.96176 Transcript_45208/m.96176 type:complete len:293 (-) Transcript_45208:281-1159(-)
MLVPKSKRVQHLVHDVPQVFPPPAPSQIHVRPRVRLLPQVGGAGPLVVPLVVEVNVLDLPPSRHEPQHSGGSLDVIHGHLDRLVGLLVEPVGILYGEGYVQPAVGPSVLRHGPQPVELVRRPQHAVQRPLLVRRRAVGVIGRGRRRIAVLRALLEREPVFPHPVGELGAVPLGDVLVARHEARVEHVGVLVVSSLVLVFVGCEIRFQGARPPVIMAMVVVAVIVTMVVAMVAITIMVVAVVEVAAAQVAQHRREGDALKEEKAKGQGGGCAAAERRRKPRHCTSFWSGEGRC